MGIFDTLQEESTFSRASGNNYNYVVLQVVLKEKFIGTGSGNLTELEKSSMSRPQGVSPAHDFYYQQRQQGPDGR